VLSPGLAILYAGALHDMSFPRFVFAMNEAHRLGHANGHRAFLGIAENQIFVSRLDRDVEVEKPLAIRAGVNAEGPFIGAGRAPSGAIHLQVERTIPCSAPDLILKKSVMDDLPRLGAFGPEIDSVDRPV